MAQLPLPGVFQRGVIVGPRAIGTPIFTPFDHSNVMAR
jgi:hypothetical protein